MSPSLQFHYASYADAIGNCSPGDTITTYCEPYFLGFARVRTETVVVVGENYLVVTPLTRQRKWRGRNARLMYVVEKRTVQ